MIPVWIAVAGLAVATGYAAINQPKQVKADAVARADVSAVNLVAYRRAVQRYLAANPATTGTISDSSLSASWQPGYIRDSQWTNLVSGGTLFVYSATSASASAKAALSSMVAKSASGALFGTKAASGRLVSVKGFDTGVTIPASIPVGAIVLIGN